MPEDDEIQIGNNTIGLGSIISLNVKTLIMIIGILYGGLSTVATIGYFNLKAEIELSKQHVEENAENIDDETDKKIENSLTIVRDDIKDLIKEQGEMKGDIKVLLEKTKDINTRIESNNTRPNINHVPVPTNP